jgi:hypothetical protein
MNVLKTTNNNTLKTAFKVSELAGGTLVRAKTRPYLEPTVYVVLCHQPNSARIGAVSIMTGGYLSPDTMVDVVSEGEEITFTAGRPTLISE